VYNGRGTVTQVTDLVAIPAARILDTTLAGFFALSGACVGCLIGAVAGRGTEGGSVRAAGLGAVAGAVVFMEALQATRGLLSSSGDPRQQWVRSPRSHALLAPRWRVCELNQPPCVRVCRRATRTCRWPWWVISTLCHCSSSRCATATIPAPLPYTHLLALQPII
jgi:hypothetical protein